MNLAVKWIKATETQLKNQELDEADEEAILELLAMATDEPLRAVDVVLEIVKEEPKSIVLNCLGAGPLEDLLVNHPELLENVFALAKNNSGLVECLSHVNLDDSDPISLRRLNQFLIDNNKS